MSVAEKPENAGRDPSMVLPPFGRSHPTPGYLAHAAERRVRPLQRRDLTIAGRVKESDRTTDKDLQHPYRRLRQVPPAARSTHLSICVALHPRPCAGCVEPFLLCRRAASSIAMAVVPPCPGREEQ